MTSFIQKDHSWIPLESVASSTYAPSNLEVNSIYTDDDAASEATTVCVHLNPTFNPTTSLQIQARGKHVVSFPSPPKQLETPIFSPVSGRPVYMCIRPRRSSGNCKLVDAKDPAEVAIARTTYRFGPGHNPIVRIGRDEEADTDAEQFEMVGTSLMKRAVRFETRRWGRFEWRYGNKGERKQYAADNLLILEKICDGEGRLKIAQLVRNDAMRTPGSSYHAAGNGGRLQTDLGHEVSEVIVIMTCLVMLKKEVDRLRTIQIMVLASSH